MFFRGFAESWDFYFSEREDSGGGLHTGVFLCFHIGGLEIHWDIMLKRLFRRRTDVKSVCQTVGLSVSQPFKIPQFDDPLLSAIHGNFLDMESVSVPGKCLDKHQITQSQRARMVDWMVEVTEQFECATQTYFLAVTIMDGFFARYGKALPSSELHVIGVTAMFMASKAEDVYPLRLKLVHERIANLALSETRIKATEITMLRSLDFCVNVTTPWDFLSLYFTLFQTSPCIEKTAEIVLRLSLMFYDTLTVLPSKRALSAFIIACTCSNRVGYVPQILSTLGLKESDISKSMNLIYAHVMSYPDSFKSCKSFSKFLHFRMVLLSPGPLFAYEDEQLEREQRGLFDKDVTW